MPVIISPVLTTSEYAFPVGLQILWAVILLVGTFFLPESPRFLIEQGKIEEAYKLIERLRRFSDEEFFKKELKQMLDQINYDEENEVSSPKGVMKKTCYRQRLILGCGIPIGQQICGRADLFWL